MTNQLPERLTLPEEIVSHDDPLHAGSIVQLPYDAAFFRWVRGQAEIPPDHGSGVKHFGGWGCNATEADALLTPLPDRFVRETFLSPEGKEYEMLCARSMALALIGTRFRWLEDENRGHTQNLCLMAEYDKESQSFVAWGPVVLTTKGTTSMAVEKRFGDWARMTAAARRDIAPDVPWWYFYTALGTFGDQRVQKMVGKDQHQSFVTPPQIHGAGTELTPAQLQMRFVGPNDAALMLEYKTLAAEWLDAWTTESEYDASTGSYKDNGTPPEPETPPVEQIQNPAATANADDFPPI